MRRPSAVKKKLKDSGGLTMVEMLCAVMIPYCRRCPD